ncbi:reverse transcriptase domain-containing protein [Tanacetum coccineum]
MEVFAWTRSERTAVPRFVMEHKLKIYPLAEPVVHKRRPVAPEGRLAMKEKVFRWLGEGLIRKMDYSGLNKACAKDMYPLPEEGEELASLMGYPYKCFLQLPKEYNQIKMAEEDEEKTGFHMEEGVYCFTHMPKELKNYAATLQRIMEKFLTDQRGWNVKIYLEEIVIKRKSKEAIKEDSGIEIILVSPEEKMYSYAIRLKFKASNYAIDCEALLAGLAASDNQGMKDLHVFIDSLTLVAQVEGNHTPPTEQERRYKKEIMDATVPFHRF